MEKLRIVCYNQNCNMGFTQEKGDFVYEQKIEKVNGMGTDYCIGINLH